MSNVMGQLSRFYILFGIIFAIILCPASLSAEEDEKGSEDFINDIYIVAPPFAVNMYHHGRLRGTMTIALKVKITDAGKRAVARKYLPRLSDAYLADANRLAYQKFDVNKPVNVAALSNAFQKSTNRLLRHNKAKVLISDVTVSKR